MGSISGNSNCSVSGSEEKLQAVSMEERKRKRMQSNRESARRSRMRKQKHLDDLMNQVNNLNQENNRIIDSISYTTNLVLNLQTENSVLRAQLMELNQSFESLNQILCLMEKPTEVITNVYDVENDLGLGYNCDLFSNPFAILINQPILASPDMFMY